MSESDDIRERVAAYFRENDGQEVFVSDVASALSLQYDQVSRAFDQLHAGGKIALASGQVVQRRM